MAETTDLSGSSSLPPEIPPPPPKKKGIPTWVIVLICVGVGGFFLLAVIGILAALAFPAIVAAIDKAKEAKTERELRILSQAVVLYHTDEGKIPQGDKRQIISVLTGKNKRKIEYIDLRGFDINASGMVTDGWGTAYFFIPEGKSQMIIRSAGKDKKLETEDDLYIEAP